MAVLRIHFFSQCLQRNVDFNMFLPNDPREGQKEPVIKTGFFLHGYTGSAEDFWELTERAEKYHCAMVMPNAENSFYLDTEATGFQYGTYVGKELVEYVRKTFHLAMKREDSFVAGLSMGGFGALHTGLAFPENFGRIIALSSALIIHEIAGIQEGEKNEVANYEYYFRCFDRLDMVEKSTNNPETLLLQLIEQNKEIPEIYMACGTEDFLLENNRAFHCFLEEHKIEHLYYEGPGIHDMVFWREYFRKGMEWAVTANKQSKDRENEL